MAGDYKPPARKKIALDNNKLSMRAPNSKGKMAGLNWMLVKNNPRLVVYTNDPEDTTDYGKITAALDAPTFFAFVQLLKRAIVAEGKFREKIDNSNFTFPGGKRSETPSVVSSLIVGKDEDGMIWISVSAPRRPQIKFHFINPDFHNFLHNDGTPYTKTECSVLYAQSYATMLELLMAHLMVTEYVAPEPKPDNGGGRGGYGGGNRGGSGGGGGGGGGSKSDDFGDADPW